MPTDEGAPAVEISDLYTKMVEYTQEYCSVGVFIRGLEILKFSTLLQKNMERRGKLEARTQKVWKITFMCRNVFIPAHIFTFRESL